MLAKMRKTNLEQVIKTGRATNKLSRVNNCRLDQWKQLLQKQVTQKQKLWGQGQEATEDKS